MNFFYRYLDQFLNSLVNDPIDWDLFLNFNNLVDINDFFYGNFFNDLNWPINFFDNFNILVFDNFDRFLNEYLLYDLNRLFYNFLNLHNFFSYRRWLLFKGLLL